MAAQERALFEPISVPSWFSMDVRLGQPCITLEPPGCFFAEEYALALGVPDVAEDVKVNYGKLVLDGECWVATVVFLGRLLVVPSVVKGFEVSMANQCWRVCETLGSTPCAAFGCMWGVPHETDDEASHVT